MEFTDDCVQKYCHLSLSRWYSQLGGWIERADIMQEAALVFLSAKKVQHAHRGDKPFMGLFKMKMHWRMIDIQREMRMKHCQIEVVADLGESESPWQTVAAVSPDAEQDLRFAVLDAPEPVRRFVLAFEAVGRKPQAEDGTLEKLAVFARRVTGMPWRRVRPMLYNWSEACL